MPTTSWPLTHQTDDALEPMASRTLGMSCGQLTTVTAQNSAPAGFFFKEFAKIYKLTLLTGVSRACQVSSWLPTVTLSPSCGMTVNWLGKYSTFTAALLAFSVCWLPILMGSRISHRGRKPSASGAFCGESGACKGEGAVVPPPAPRWAAAS